MKFRSVAVVAPKILRSRFYQQRFFAAEATTTTAPSSSSTPKNRLSLFYDVITPQEEEKVLAYLTPLLAKRRYEGAHWDSVITRYKEIELHPPFDSQATNAYEEVENILNKVRNNIREQCQEPDLKFLSTHCIDLASDGHIGGHIDSVKFSGDMICGLSLGSQRTMMLSRDIQEENMKYASSDDERDMLRLVSSSISVEEYEIKMEKSRIGYKKGNKRLLEGAHRLFPPEIRMILPARSLYIMKGVTRYFYAHSVLGKQFNPTPHAQGTYIHAESQTGNEVSEITDNSLFKKRISLIFRN